MISGKLPNNTVWWLSSDGQKIWIESEDLEQEKFKEKGCSIAHGRIFYAGKEVGELATSRLDSRKHKDAWVIKLEAMLHVYPELVEEIDRKSIVEKKKKKITKKTIRPEPLKMVKEPLEDVNKENINKETIVNKETTDTEKREQPYFDITRQYIPWIKEEISKSGKMVISLKDLKEKMGDEFVKMHDIRIYFGLNKLLSNIGITIEVKSTKGGSIAILKKI